MAKSLIERRLALGLTRTEVATLTNLSRQTIINYERHRGNYVAQKYQRLIDLYDRLERNAAKAEENNDARI